MHTNSRESQRHLTSTDRMSRMTPRAWIAVMDRRRGDSIRAGIYRDVGPDVCGCFAREREVRNVFRQSRRTSWKRSGIRRFHCARRGFKIAQLAMR